MTYQTTTNDPLILDLVNQQKKAVKAWEAAMAEEQRLYAEKSPQHRAGLAKLDETLATIHTIQTALCESFIYALEHSSEATL